jgi:ketosteroid isomerase-like protein
MRKSVLLLLAVVCVASACSTAAPGEEFGMKDQAAIREKNADFVKAFNARNMDQMLAAYTENSVFMPPNQPVLRGKDALKTFYDEMLKGGGTNLKLDAGEISGHGPLAYQSGSYELDMKPAGGAETHDRGKYLFILRKMAGTWRYEYTVWNSDLPPPAR